MKIFLLIGQSNMAGPSGTRWNEEDDKGLSGVMLLNGNDIWEEAKNPLNAYSTVKLSKTPGLSPGSSFAACMKETLDGETVGIVSNCRGASKIAQWQKGTLYFEEAVRRAKAARQDAKIDGILWLQGEQDVTPKEDHINYAEHLRTFIYDLREALGGQDIPFLTCEIWGDIEYAKEEWHEGIIDINRQIREVVSTTEYCEMITSKGLEHTVGDEVHFSPSAMRILGKRFAEKFIETWIK